MALRWDLKPLFKNARPDDFEYRFTRRSLISGIVAVGALVVGTWGLPYWQFLIIAVAVIAAFDAGDMAVPFEDDEIFEEVEPADDPDADRPLTAREKLYRPVEER